jgi:hypothetical protein
MQVHISIGENHRFELREALLIYSDRQRSFVTRHQVTLHKQGPPTLEPAQPLSWISGVVGAFTRRQLHGRSLP